jgi:hypothetical protein
MQGRDMALLLVALAGTSLAVGQVRSTVLVQAQWSGSPIRSRHMSLELRLAQVSQACWVKLLGMQWLVGVLLIHAVTTSPQLRALLPAVPWVALSIN